MWSLHESTHVPSAMKSPSRNIPISTVIVAANVVEMFAVIEDHASENNNRNRLTRRRTPHGARRAPACRPRGR